MLRDKLERSQNCVCEAAHYKIVQCLTARRVIYYREVVCPFS